MACPSWLRPGGSLGHLKARTRGHGTMQIFQPELLESIFGAKPPKRRHPEIPCHDPTFSKRFQAGSVPRDSMRATKLSRGKAAMGRNQRRRPPPALSGRGGIWHPPVFQGSQLRWRKKKIPKETAAKTSDTMNGRGNQKATTNIK